MISGSKLEGEIFRRWLHPTEDLYSIPNDVSSQNGREVACHRDRQSPTLLTHHPTSTLLCFASCLLVVSEIILLHLPIETSCNSTFQLLQPPSVLLYWLLAQKKRHQWWNNQTSVALQRKIKWTLQVNLRTIVRPLADWSCGAARIRVLERGWMTMMRPQSNNYCPVMSWSNEHENKAGERSLAFYCSLDCKPFVFDVQWLLFNKPHYLWGNALS